MFLILVIAGSVLAVFGVGAVVFGIPSQALDIGSTLIISGTVAFVGGLILAGIGVAVGELTRIADALRTRPAVRPARPVEAFEPAPATQPIPPPAARIPMPPRPKAESSPGVAGFEPRAETRTAEQRIAALRPLSPAPPPEVAAYAPRSAEARASESPVRIGTPEQRPVRSASSPPPLSVEAPPRAVEPRVPRPQVNSTVEASASAMERLGSAVPRPERKADVVAENVPLSPNGGSGSPRPAAGVAADDGPPSSAEEIQPTGRSETKEPRLDFLFRSKPSRSRPADPAFDVMWPKRPGRSDDVETKPVPLSLEAVLAEEAAEEDGAPPLLLRSPSAAEAESEMTPLEPAEELEARAEPPKILKSGVVDGMPYTLYSDGAIEAQLPEGTVRFGSITELRARIESSE